VHELINIDLHVVDFPEWHHRHEERFVIFTTNVARYLTKTPHRWVVAPRAHRTGHSQVSENKRIGTSSTIGTAVAHK
jgi:hypothetical protein